MTHDSDESATTPLHHSAPASARPDTIGRYRIIRRVGQGGMGTVYEAEQESPKRTVAVKVIRAGLTNAILLKRFEHEAQTLGRLQHPGIAHVFEAGTAATASGPQPFFAMEFIRGPNLRDWVARRNPSVRERLELVAKICDAVHHAHQKGVIHRDLKPGNILVDDSGQPKILDFGVARVTDPDLQLSTLQTDVGQLVGTIQYMSPEQVSSPDDLDTRSDVYALGVILYEMLANRLPYRTAARNLPEAVRMILEEEPTSLSSVHRAFRGDVATIVAKALEKEKTRRYESAEQLAADLRRYLRDEPIVARPPSRLYQVRKFAKRNRALVGGVVAAFVLLVAGTVISTREAVRATRAERVAAGERDRASLEAETSEQVSAFLQSLFEVSNPDESRGEEVTAREMLDRGAARIREELRDQPAVQARLMERMGHAYLKLGTFDEAGQLLRAAVETSRGLDEPDENLTARCLENLAELYWQHGDLDSSEVMLRETLDTRVRLLGPDAADVGATLSNLGTLYWARGRYAEAESLMALAVGIAEKTEGPEQIAHRLHNLAAIRDARGDYEGAIEMYRRVIAIREDVLGDHPELARSLTNLAVTYQRLERDDEAEPLLVRALAMREKTLGTDHHDVAQTLNSLGLLYQREGRLDEAEPLLERSLEIRRNKYGDEHAAVAEALHNLAVLYSDRERLAEARDYAERSLTIREKVLRPEHPAIAAGLNTVGTVDRKEGRFDEAEALYRRGLAIREKALGPEHADTAASLELLAALLVSRGRGAEAVPLAQRCVEIREKILGEDNPRVAEARETLDAARELARPEPSR